MNTVLAFAPPEIIYFFMLSDKSPKSEFTQSWSVSIVQRWCHMDKQGTWNNNSLKLSPLTYAMHHVHC